MVPHADNKWRNSANNCQLKPPKLWVAPAMYRLYRASAAMGTCTWNWRFKMKQQNANSNRFSMLCMLYSDPNIQIVHPSLWGTGHPSPTLTCTSSASHSQIQAGHEDPPIANDALPVGLVFVSAFKCAEKSEKYTSLACALWTFLPMKSAKYQSSGRLFSILICDTCSEPKKKIWWCFWADVGLCKSLRKQIPQFRAKRCNVAWPSGISAINEVVGMQNHGFFSPNPSVSIVFSGCQKFSHFQNLKKGTPNKSKINVADALANGTNNSKDEWTAKCCNVAWSRGSNPIICTPSSLKSCAKSHSVFALAMPAMHRIAQIRRSAAKFDGIGQAAKLSTADKEQVSEPRQSRENVKPRHGPMMPNWVSMLEARPRRHSDPSRPAPAPGQA